MVKVKSKQFLILIILTIFILTTFMLSSCKASKPEATIDTFITSLNDFDLDKMIECFEPKLAKMMQSSLNIGNKFSKALTGIDLDARDVLNLLPIFSGMQIDENTTFELPKFNHKILKSDTNKDTSEILVNLSCTIGQNSYAHDYIFDMVKIDSNWCIANIR